MKTFRKLIEFLVEIETRLCRCIAARQETKAAVRRALNGCRI